MSGVLNIVLTFLHLFASHLGAVGCRYQCVRFHGDDFMEFFLPYSSVRNQQNHGQKPVEWFQENWSLNINREDTISVKKARTGCTLMRRTWFSMDSWWWMVGKSQINWARRSGNAIGYWICLFSLSWCHPKQPLHIPGLLLLFTWNLLPDVQVDAEVKNMQKHSLACWFDPMSVEVNHMWPWSIYADSTFVLTWTYWNLRYL